MKQKCLSLCSGNKGFVFALDVAIAAIVVTILLLIANNYTTRTDDSLAKTQAIKTGSDIVALLDHKDILDALDRTQIEQEIRTTLPPQFEMRLEITGTFQENRSIMFETTNFNPESKFIGTGKRIFVFKENDDYYYATAKYWIWYK